MEPSRRHVNRLRETLRGLVLHPEVIGPGIEGWNHRLAGPARTEHPFVRAGDQKIMAQFAHVEVLNPQRVDAVHAEDDPVLLTSGVIDVLNCANHIMDWQFEARVGMDPGDGDDACCGSDLRSQRIDQCVVRNGFERAIQRNLRHGGVRPFGTETQGGFG